MSFLDHYQLFLFDFDGLLVNTEELHYKAYCQLAGNRGYHFPFDFATYSRYALFRSTGPYELFCRANEVIDQPLWAKLYAEKKQLYEELLVSTQVELMPGAHRLLEKLFHRKAKTCLVTHSPQEHIEKLFAMHPILETLNHLVCRQDYTHPKPHPESYQRAIERYASASDRVIGFEDSPRGLQALVQTAADAVFVSAFLNPTELTELSRPPTYYFTSLTAL